ncbi:MAG: sensor domain-containing diguanylate cyclase [Actinomycetota bacterium]
MDTVMMSPPIIENEAARLRSVESLRVLDTPAEPAFDELVELAAWTCHVPIAAISLVDSDRQWFKAEIGLGVPETDRAVAICSHTISDPSETLIVPDTLKDARFAENPFVTGDSEIRFYAGVPLVVDDDRAVGTLCVLDTRPRSLFSDERRALEIIGRQVRDKLAAIRLEWTDTDPLTGASSRIAAARWLQAQRTDRPRAAIHLDVDGLAAVNRRDGQQAGDRLLATVAARIRETAPAGAMVTRSGDDEFTVLTDEVDHASLFEMIESIRVAIARDHDISADVSMGLATAEPGEDGQDLILAATRATELEKRLRDDA